MLAVRTSCLRSGNSRIAGIQAGSFLIPGQPVAYISNDSNLLAECYVSPADIGYIKENQKVAFQLDAFNYNQWGLAHGVVREISKDIVTLNEQPVFRVRSSLDTKYLQLKDVYKGNLKKGMTLTCRFYLTDRSLWQLLFDKIDNCVNPKLQEQTSAAPICWEWSWQRSSLASIYKSSVNSFFSNNSSEFVSRIFTIIVLWIGSYFVIDNAVTPGELMSFYALMVYIRF